MAKWGEINCAALEERLDAAQRDAKEAEEALAETDALWEGMERALEESDAREARLERWLRESETREATLNDRITMLEEHLCLTQEKLDEADGALNICSASWGECNRILDETKAKLAKAVEALKYYAEHEILNLYYDDAGFARDTLADLKGRGDE